MYIMQMVRANHLNTNPNRQQSKQKLQIHLKQ